MINDAKTEIRKEHVNKIIYEDMKKKLFRCDTLSTNCVQDI
jgi:hypothetical protein